jgi:hypothetical protein
MFLSMITVSLVTKTSDGTGTGTFQSTLTGLAGNIKYYVRAYAITGSGTTYGEEKVFTTLPENTVVGANGKIWMDRNLGASRVATSSTDSVGFGDLYQWGRAKDGHQLRTSATTATLASVDKPATSDFIKRRKILPSRSISRAKSGKSIPTSTPKIMEEKIQSDNFLRLKEIRKRIAIKIYLAILNGVGSTPGKALSIKKTKPM